MSSNMISYVQGSVQRTQEVRSAERAQSTANVQAAKVNGKALPPDSQKVEADDPRLVDAISELKDFVQNIQRNLEFSVDEDSGRIIVKVIDAQSKEVIRQIPPEEVVQLASTLQNAKDGVILKAKA